MISGTLQFKLQHGVVDVSGDTAVRVAPGAVRSVSNEGPEDAQPIIVSARIENARDAELVQGSWAA